MSQIISAQISLNSKFLWTQNIFGAESFLTKSFLNQTFSGQKRSNVLDLHFFCQQTFLASHFFYSKFLWTQIFWAQHFLDQKLMSIWPNLELQSNCLSLDWAPAQLQLVLFWSEFKVFNIKDLKTRVSIYVLKGWVILSHWKYLIPSFSPTVYDFRYDWWTNPN